MRHFCLLLLLLRLCPSTSAGQAGLLVTSFHAALEFCSTLSEPQRTQGVALSFLQLAHDPQLLEYFYGNESAARFRLPGCTPFPTLRGGDSYARDQVWRAIVPHAWRTRQGEPVPRCLWSNMPFGKSVALLALARALGVTHIVESGRMGGEDA